MSEDNENKEKVPEAITEPQVDAAIHMLKQLYPISNTSLTTAYPYLGYICCCLGDWSPGAIHNHEDLKVKEKEPLLEKGQAVQVAGQNKKFKTKKNKKEANLDQDDIKKDPFILLGSGMVAYRNLMYAMIWTFFLFTIVMTPVLYAFSSYDGYSNIPHAIASYEIYSLGALGYSSTQCGVSQFGNMSHKLAMNCPYGTVGQLMEFGVNPAGTDQTICQTVSENQMCSPPSSSSIRKEFSQAIDSQSSSVSMTVDQSNIYGNNLVPAGCTATDAWMFVQFSCVQQNDAMVTKYSVLCVIAVIGVFVNLLFLQIIRTLRQNAKIQRLEWDLSTITAGDYTVELDIKSKAYKNWVETEYLNGAEQHNVAPVTAYKESLIHEVQDWLRKGTIQRERSNATDDSKKSKRNRKVSQQIEEDIDITRIADVIFAYDNKNLINLLKQRGAAIANLKFDQMREVEAKIDLIINEEFEKLTEPVSAFIIFEEEDGVIAALDLSEYDPEAEMLGQKMHLKPATEPTNIIWENRYLPIWRLYARLIFVTVVAGILLAISFYVIFLTQAAAIQVSDVFPPTTDCTDIKDDYGTSLEEYAAYEYLEYESNNNAFLAGAFQCFCQQEVADLGYTAAYDTEYQLQPGTSNTAPICGTFITVVTTAYVLSESLCYCITAINYVLRVIVIMLIHWIGFSTETEQLSWITTGVFLTQFFNTAFLLLMVNADLSEQPINFGVTSGNIADFNMDWFRSTGNSLIDTILFIAYWPLIEFFMYWGMRLGFQCLDRGCNSCDKYKTKKTSLLQYMNLYAGPEYFMHYKYSAILNVVFCTFMYGFGLPLLFPIAFVTFVILYFVEKSMLYWSYRLPPMYDQRLNDDVLSKLQWAPVFFFIFGYWMLSSNQLINNELYSQTNVKSTPLTGHVMGEVFESTGWEVPAWPYLLLFILLIIHLTVGNWIYACVYKCFPQLQIGDVDLDEDIDNYYKALDTEDRDWSRKEEENARQIIGFKTMSDHTLIKLQTTISSDAVLKGVHTYDILANPLYSDKFQYFSSSLDDREMYIIDDDSDEENDNAQSDLVKVALNLGYMTKANALKFKFSKEDFRISAQAMGGLGTESVDRTQINQMV